MNLRKIAKAGWKPTGVNLTDKFADLENRQMRAAAIGGIGAGIGGGAGGALAGAAGAILLHSGKDTPRSVEKLPEFDPDTGAYIGMEYAIPASEEQMQALHKKLVGKEWKPSIPAWLEWLMAERKQRIRASIIKAIEDGKVDTTKLTKGELASLVFPKLLMQDGSLARNTGFWRWRRYPVKGIFTARPITNKDIQEYRKNQHKEASYNNMGQNGMNLQVIHNAMMSKVAKPESIYPDLYDPIVSMRMRQRWEDEQAKHQIEPVTHPELAGLDLRSILSGDADKRKKQVPPIPELPGCRTYGTGDIPKPSLGTRVISELSNRLFRP